MPDLETETSTHERTSDGILISRMKNHAFESYEHSVQNGEVLLKLKGDDPPMPLLVDFARASGQSMESRKYYAEKSVQWCSKAALLVRSPVSRVIGNIYMGLNKPIVPTRMFTDEEKAMEWLREKP